jgi:hypothetical protein
MPRYYFHIEDHRTYIDRVGVELPDLEAARDEAVGAAGQILRDGAAKNLWSGKPWRMWVTQPSSFGFLRWKNEAGDCDDGVRQANRLQDHNVIPTFHAKAGWRIFAGACKCRDRGTSGAPRVLAWRSLPPFREWHSSRRG